MNSDSLKFQNGSPQPDRHAELIRTHAEMLAAEATVRAAKRRVELEEMHSDLKSPEDRVRAWERVHGLTLPADPNHPILHLVATNTRLTVPEVQAVQRNEAARRAANASRPKP